jgi:hypothetical protein
MSDPVTDALVDRYAMGMAYLSITAQLGPSHHLVAFVNYDKVTGESIGLESFDIMDQHEAIVAEILADPSMNMACESFMGRLKSVAERFKNKITFNRADNLTDMMREPLSEKSSNIYTISKGQAERALRYIDDAFKTLDFILPKIPGGTDGDAWEKFYKAHIQNSGSSQLGAHIRNTERNAAAFEDFGKEDDFAKGGWNVATFKGTLKAIAVSQDKYHTYADRVTDTCDQMAKLLLLIKASQHQQRWDSYSRQSDVMNVATSFSRGGDDHKNRNWVEHAARSATNEMARQNRRSQHEALMKMVPAHVLVSMNKASKCVSDAVALIIKIEHWLYKSMIHVSRHYEINHK